MKAQRTKAIPSRPSGRVGVGTFGVLALLLVLPGWALSRATAAIDWRWLVGVPLAVSVFAFFAYRDDKRRAETEAWRTPESTLHLLELLGGWPGAFLAQRMFRHKVVKLSFQFVFWSVVLLHQYVALDSLLDWQCTREAVRFIKGNLS